MSQIMEPKPSETVLLYHVLEMVGDKVRRDQLAVWITAHKAFMGSVKIGFQELGVHFLFLLLLNEHPLDMGNQRERSHACFCLQCIVHHDLLMT